MSNPANLPPRRPTVLPALVALVTGLLVGAGVALLFGPGAGPRGAAEPPVTVTVTASPSPPPPGTTRVTVDVPDECLAVATRGAGIATRLNEALEAARRLQLDRARRVLDEIAQENPGELATKAERCRSAIEALTTASESPVASPS